MHEIETKRKLGQYHVLREDQFASNAINFCNSAKRSRFNNRIKRPKAPAGFAL